MAVRWALVAMVLVAGCSVEQPVRAAAPRSTRAPATTQALPAVDPSRPRVVLLHGLASGFEQFAEPPFDGLVSGLQSQGWQVIFVEYPVASTQPRGALAEALRRDPGAYREAWLHDIRQIISAGDGPVLLGGVSWGGWHVLTAASLPGVTAWFVHVPVTKVSALEEFADIDTTAIDVRDLAGVTAPGLVRWATRDERVDGGLAPVVAATASGTVEVEEVDEDHTTTADDVSAILAWTAALPGGPSALQPGPS